MSKSTRVLVACAGVIALGLVRPSPSHASFHLMQIEQVIGGVNGDVTAQAIQLRMRSFGQNLVHQARLVAHDAAGLNPVLVIDMTTDVFNASAGSRVLIASSSFLTQTSPTTVPDFTIGPSFTMTNLIPAAYLAAGTLTFEDDFGTVYWRLSWGGGGYTGSGAVLFPFGNDNDGNANPPFGGALPSTSLQALRFTGVAGDQSTRNVDQYAITAGAAVFTNNGDAMHPPGSFTVIGSIPTGACCNDNAGICTNSVTQSTCVGAGNRYGGDNSTCATLNPPCTGPTGACCDDSTGTCSEPVTQSTCTGTSRRYGGDNSTCGNINPPCVPPPPPLFPIALKLIAGGSQTAAGPTLASPLGITDAGDGTGRLFIHDQAGQIRVIDAGGNLLPDPFLDISALLPPLGIDFGGGFIYDERGLLGLAFHPNYANNGKFYVRYSKPRTSTGSEPCDLLLQVQPPRCHEEVLAEYTVLGDPLTSNTADATSEVILFRWDKPQFNHNAGHIAFGPDGMLYISTGDGGGANDGLADGEPPGSAPTHGPFGNGQNIEAKLGKMIRIDVDGTDGPGGLYGIPPTNPFVGKPGLDEIYAYGFRNPFRFSFDDDLGGDNSLYVADVGQDIYEEVDRVVNGGNYGWVIREGLHCFDPLNPATPPPSCPTTGAMGEPLIDPISEYSHTAGGLAVVGGYVYRGAAYPQLQGKYVYGDFSANFGPTGRLYYFDLSGPDAFVRKEFFLAPSGAPFGKFLKGLGRDADGEIYVAASGVLGPSGTTGVIYKIVPPSPGNPAWNPDPLNADRATRFLKFQVTASVPASEAAIKVTMVDLQNPVPSNAPCCPPQNFGAYESATCTASGETNGCARWVGKPGTFLESQDTPSLGNYRAARLQCTPFYHDWTTETATKPVTVVGAEIMPSSEYNVQTYGASCMGNEATCTNVSAPVTMRTRRSGDVESLYNPPDPSGQPNAIDIAQLVAKFKNTAGAPSKARAQIQPNLPELNGDISALDISAVVDAVKGIAYPFSGPCPCPSAVVCGATACPSGVATCIAAYGAGAMCVKTCSGGANDGQPCVDNNVIHNHCPGGTCGNPMCRDRCGRCSP